MGTVTQLDFHGGGGVGARRVRSNISAHPINPPHLSTQLRTPPELLICSRTRGLPAREQPPPENQHKPHALRDPRPRVLLATLLGGARRPRVKEGRAARGDRLPAQPMTGVCPAPPSRPGAEGRARGGWGSGPSKEFRGSQEEAPSSPRPGCAPSGPLLRSQPQFPPIQGSPQWVPTVRGMGACRRVWGTEGNSRGPKAGRPISSRQPEWTRRKRGRPLPGLSLLPGLLTCSPGLA